MTTRRPLYGILALFASTILMAACSTGHDAQIEPGGATVAASPSVALDPAVEHVHGAVVLNGVLLLGTHGGLVEVDPATGTTTRRGTAQDDLMGLASDGPTLVASGHPGPGSDLPDPLGLLRSDDGGSSWQSVSLTGEVDFHGLAADGSRIAGIGTQDGVLLSQDDGRTWQDTGVVDATSLAWFQGGLWITTGAGLQVWRDGTLTDAPPMDQSPIVLAAADDASALWAILADGTVWRTADGTSWDRRGAVTALESLAATADTAYAITADSVTAIPSR